MKHIAEFMEHPMTRSFYETCLAPESVDSTLLFLWLYANIEKHAPEHTPYEKLGMLYRIISHPELRYEALQEYERYREHVPQRTKKKICYTHANANTDTTPRTHNHDIPDSHKQNQQSGRSHP